MAKSVTLADVARKSKVSLSTVSLVLRDKPGIPPETRKRVLEAARTLGYRPKVRPALGPDRLARSPAGRGLHTIGLIVKAEWNMPAQANPFYSYVLAGIEEACRRGKINLLYATLPVDQNNVPVDVPRLLAEEQVDGLLLVGALVDENHRALLEAWQEPVVLVDAYSSAAAYDAVVSDNVRGAYEAVKHLIELGHREIGLVGSHPGAYPSIRERRQGYIQALSDHGLRADYFADAWLSPDEAARAASALLSEHPGLTALFGVNDEVAIAAMRAAQSLGRRIPDDLSIVGFDDIDLAQHVSPPLTTMHVDKIGMGRVAVQLLRHRLEFPDSEHITTVLHPRLKLRASTAPRR